MNRVVISITSSARASSVVGVVNPTAFAVAKLKLGDAMLDYLVKLHWLADCDIRDRRKVGEAIARALFESAEAE